MRAAGAALVGLALLAAACGSGDDGDSATGDTIDESIKEAINESTTTSQITEKEPTSMAEWEALWAEQRAAIVQADQGQRLGQVGRR